MDNCFRSEKLFEPSTTNGSDVDARRILQSDEETSEFLSE